MILVAWTILAFTIWREVSVISMIREQQRAAHLQTLQAMQAALQNPAPANTAARSYGVQVMPNKVATKPAEDASVKNTGIQIVAAQNGTKEEPFDVSQAVFETLLRT